MAGRSRVLPVPYFAQPTGVTCQSTVLKMFASYLEASVLARSTGAGERDVLDIWKDINTGTERPVQVQNAHKNMLWWLEKHFPGLVFSYSHTTAEDVAAEAIVGFVDHGYPVLVAVSHARVAGHIVLVTGYENYVPASSSADFRLVIHDPYGRFDPSLSSRLFGQRRWEGGASLMGGGTTGPGRAVRVPLTAASRQKKGDAARGTYYLLSVA